MDGETLIKGQLGHRSVDQLSLDYSWMIWNY